MTFNDCPEMENIYEVFTEATYELCFSLLMYPVHLVHIHTQEGQWSSKLSNTLHQMFLSRLHEEHTEENVFIKSLHIYLSILNVSTLEIWVSLTENELMRMVLVCKDYKSDQNHFSCVTTETWSNSVRRKCE